jgi:hypothetical protein
MPHSSPSPKRKYLQSHLASPSPSYVSHAAMLHAAEPLAVEPPRATYPVRLRSAIEWSSSLSHCLPSRPSPKEADAVRCCCRVASPLSTTTGRPPAQPLCQRGPRWRAAPLRPHNWPPLTADLSLPNNSPPHYLPLRLPVTGPLRCTSGLTSSSLRTIGP